MDPVSFCDILYLSYYPSNVICIWLVQETHKRTTKFHRMDILCKNISTRHCVLPIHHLQWDLKVNNHFCLFTASDFEGILCIEMLLPFLEVFYRSNKWMALSYMYNIQHKICTCRLRICTQVKPMLHAKHKTLALYSAKMGFSC